MEGTIRVSIHLSLPNIQFGKWFRTLCLSRAQKYQITHKGIQYLTKEYKSSIDTQTYITICLKISIQNEWKWELNVVKNRKIKYRMNDSLQLDNVLMSDASSDACTQISISLRFTSSL